MARTRNRSRKRKHDASYKRIFAHRRTIGDLLRGFAGKLARHLDFSTLERLPASFVTEHLGQRHADMLWKIQTADGSCLYLLVLLEFQTPVSCSPRCLTSCLGTAPYISIFCWIRGRLIPLRCHRRMSSR